MTLSGTGTQKRGGTAGWWLLVGLGLSALFPAPAIWDAVSRQEVPFATLDQPLAYLLGAPLFGVWDALSLLTLSQHYAFLVSLVVFYVLWRFRRPRGKLTILGRFGMEIVKGGIALGLLFLFYAGGMLIPRPMVGLELADADRFSVDFHSHTNQSHDGWSAFTAHRNRNWHEGGGFDAAYITDHYNWRGVDEALQANPDRAGDGLLILGGVEIRLRGRPTNALGDRTRYTFALDSTWHFLDPDSIRAAHRRGGPDPTLLYTMPGPLDRVVPFSVADPSGVIAIEINDGAPRGLEEVKAKREALLTMADTMDIALIAGANLHGWGRTVAAWNVLEIPGWQDLDADAMGDAIEAHLHRERRGAVTVVERRMPYHEGSVWGLALTAPMVLTEMLRMLSFSERMAWVMWVLLIMGMGALRRPTLAEEV